MTIAVMVTRNGFAVVGKSVPPDPKDYDAETGKRLARDDDLGQLRPLERYLVRECLQSVASAEHDDAASH